MVVMPRGDERRDGSLVVLSARPGRLWYREAKSEALQEAVNGWQFACQDERN